MKGHGLLCSSVLFAGSGQGETKQVDEEEEENEEGAAVTCNACDQLSEREREKGVGPAGPFSSFLFFSLLLVQ